MERNTRQKAAVVSALEAATGPMSPPAILDRARDACPGIGIATVYRILKALIDAGRVTMVELAGARRYELARHDHHHHFLCRACGEAFEITRCTSEVNKLAPRGFRVEAHEITLYGICAPCVRGG